MTTTRRLSRYDLVPLVALLGQGCTYLALAPRHAAPLPVHWGPGGSPDRWVGPGQAFLEGAALGGGLWLFLLALEHLGRELPALGLVLRPIRILAPTGAFLLGTALLARPLLGEAALGLGIGAFILCTLGGVVTGIARLPPEALDPPPDDLALRTPEAWSWGGLIYRNPEDDRLWVPKRDGGGWTCNLAHPRGRRLLVSTLALPLGLLLLLFLLQVLA